MLRKNKYLFLWILVLSAMLAATAIIACGDDDDDDELDEADDDDDDDSSGDDDSADDDTVEVPDCNSNQICERWITECEIMPPEDSDACVAWYNDPLDCEDKPGFHDCNCKCHFEHNLETDGEQFCGTFQICMDNCWTGYCPGSQPTL